MIASVQIEVAMQRPTQKHLNIQLHDSWPLAQVKPNYRAEFLVKPQGHHVVFSDYRYQKK
jgi:hypothetical protein